MRRLCALALLAALGAAFVVSEARAQAQVIPAWVRNNIRVPVQQGADALPTQEQYPASSFAIFKPNWLGTRLQARLAGGPPPTAGVFMQDSTDATDVRGANWLAADFYPTFSDSVAAVALAIQFRWHPTSGVVDTSTSFIEKAVRAVAAASGTPARDSIGSLTFMSKNSNSLPDSLATPDEQVLVLTNISGKNRGVRVRIRIPDGLSLNSSGAFLSLCVRYLNGYNASGAAWGNGVSGFEPSMRLNVALVGGR